MKRLLSIATAVTFALSSTSVFAQEVQVNQESEKSIAMTNLKNEKSALEELKKSLSHSKIARRGWIVASVSAGAVAILTAIPGVIVGVNGVKNLAQGQQFMGDPDSGGAFMIPVVIVATAVSAASGYGAYKSYQQIELRAQDIEALMAKIEAKKADITKAENLLNTLIFE